MYLSKVWFGLFFNVFTTYLSWATCNVTVSSYPKVPNVKKYILEDTCCDVYYISKPGWIPSLACFVT